MTLPDSAHSIEYRLNTVYHVSWWLSVSHPAAFHTYSMYMLHVSSNWFFREWPFALWGITTALPQLPSHATWTFLSSFSFLSISSYYLICQLSSIIGNDRIISFDRRCLCEMLSLLERSAVGVSANWILPDASCIFRMQEHRYFISPCQV